MQSRMPSLLALLFLFGFSGLAAAATLSGIATDKSGGLLPGVTVTLQSVGDSLRTYTDAGGRYQFDQVPEGKQTLRFELSGFETVTSSVTVSGEKTKAGTAALDFDAETESITLNCGSPCSDERYEGERRPTCVAWDLDGSLIEAAKRGDASSLQLLAKRFDWLDNHSERARIGAELLGRLADDSAVWRPLVAEAEEAVKSVGKKEELAPDFVARFETPEQAAAAFIPLVESLQAIAEDPRARPLLLRALATGHNWLTWIAIDGLARQHDLTALPAIDEALARLEGSNQTQAAFSLSVYRSEEADAVARKYLDEDDLPAYLSCQKEPEP
jgi:Carboxypeptidase regulatory-like domain